MKFELIIILIIFGFVLAMLIFAISYQQKLIRRHNAKKREYNSEMTLRGTLHRHGMPNINAYAPVDVFLVEDKLILECKERKFELLLDKLTSVKFTNKTNLLTQASNPAGIGKKYDKGSYLIINYISLGGSRTIVLELKSQVIKAVQISNYLTEIILDRNTVEGTIQL
ncbi:hypothetical protein KQI88_11265 [Alkaliphilus sp. MSJ-5]|uniref:Uncharacterized protein n=1 Tax=Alkaliphilus flagellatus TaxID=2841507 RepID=A0ABS6G5U3_9FIRM|nr:hypothetical protein [Alkaliphilus flagellatus]MBU5676993.1 hypothetical protein [Alkaliphilus flagellatus]